MTALRGLDEWYADWQNAEHARRFDGRSALSDKNLARNYDSFNDVRLLVERLDPTRDLRLLEVGCATGEFFRYLRVRYPGIQYCGIDVSRSAVARAKEKYQTARFFVTDRDTTIMDALLGLGVAGRWEVVYSKDVVHHQTRPLEFVSQLLAVTSEMLIMRVRTRDLGQTVTDPELSCQYHYKGWMPYIVINMQELLDHIRHTERGCEVVAYRNHMVLGGQHNRYLPKECYLAETGTAETAVGVFLKTDRPGRVVVEDRRDQDVRYPLGYRLKQLAARAVRKVAGRGASP